MGRYRSGRPAWLAGLAVAGIIGAAGVASPPAAAAARAPSTRDGVAGLLVQDGFSSIVRLQQSDATWIGEGVRNGNLLDFSVDQAGHLSTHPSKSGGTTSPSATRG